MPTVRSMVAGFKGGATNVTPREKKTPSSSLVLKERFDPTGYKT